MLLSMIARLVRAVHPPLRGCLAGLWLAGAVIAGFTAVRAALRLGIGSGAVFAVVALALTGLAVGVLRAARWALMVSLFLAGAQLVGVVGAAWELWRGGETTKTRQLQALDVDATVGITLNLVYSCLAAALFGWAMVRALHVGACDVSEPDERGGPRERRRPP
jgi:hypothetical protein